MKVKLKPEANGRVVVAEGAVYWREFVGDAESSVSQEEWEKYLSPRGLFEIVD